MVVRHWFLIRCSRSEEVIWRENEFAVGGFVGETGRTLAVMAM